MNLKKDLIQMKKKIKILINIHMINKVMIIAKKKNLLQIVLRDKIIEITILIINQIANKIILILNKKTINKIIIKNF